jgi:RluA family pseudouridine synthase
LANAHRLDFETSGLILLARNKPALVNLANQFGAEKTSKTYVALIQGSPPENTFHVDAKLSPHPAKPGLMRVDTRGGKRAVTNFEVIERYQGYTLIKCYPLTGRTHQIRAHLKFGHHPIVADTTYEGHPLLLSRLKQGYRLKPGKKERPLLDRVALHAESLAVNHPVTGARVTMTAPWPKDLRVAVKYLRLYALSGANPGARVETESDEAPLEPPAEMS